VSKKQTKYFVSSIEVQLVQDQCTICYENFPVFFQLPCARGHEFCAACVERILKVGDNRNCPKCRAPFPKFVSEWLSMIKIYPTYLTKDIPLEKLQIAFPLICRVAKLSTVIKCVKMGIDINIKGFQGFFPVHLISQTDVLKYLLEHGANVNQTRNDGVTPLYMSAQHGNLPVVQYLIDSGANINQPKNDGVTPLYMSSGNGHLPVVQYLVENCGANVNQSNNDGFTPLYMSSQNGHLQVVQYLEENGANVNQPPKNGVTPLATAIYNNQTEVAKFLLNKNANIEATKLCLKNNNWLEQIDILEDLCKQMKE
jgi:ankyrin repeat protein